MGVRETADMEGGAYRWGRDRRVAIAAGFAAAALTVTPVPAAAHDPESECLTQQLYGSDPQCKGHWGDSRMLYHWG